MHKSIRMNISPLIPFLSRGIILMFTCSFARTKNEVEHPWGLYYHGEFLCVLRSNFLFYELRGALQHINSVVQLACKNFYRRYIGVCYQPPVRVVCPNHEVVVFQTQTVDAPDLYSVANINTIIALPPHLIQPCSGYPPPPSPRNIYYYSPIFHPSILILYFFENDPPPHLDWAQINLPPGRRLYLPEYTAFMRFPLCGV